MGFSGIIFWKLARLMQIGLKSSCQYAQFGTPQAEQRINDLSAVSRQSFIRAGGGRRAPAEANV
jgi:hypothetical protein